MFYLDNHQRSRLGFLATLQVRVRHLYTSDDWRLWTGRRRRASRGGGLYDRPRPRSELREAIVCVLQYLVGFVQMKDRLRVLRFKNREGVSREQIVKATGLSLWRVRASIRHLEACGYIGSFQPRDDKDGTYRGRPSIRWVTFDLFRRVGVWGAFKRLRKHLGQSWPPRESKPPQQPLRAFARGVRLQV